jgi:hypothetical protein
MVRKDVGTFLPGMQLALMMLVLASEEFPGREHRSQDLSEQVLIKSEVPDVEAQS